MYKVIADFADAQDKGYIYREGDTYPREGVEPSEERLKELLSGSNRFGRSLIEEVAENVESVKEEPKKIKTQTQVERRAYDC